MRLAHDERRAGQQPHALHPIGTRQGGRLDTITPAPDRVPAGSIDEGSRGAVDDLPEDLLVFLQTTIGSIWALDLMLTLRRHPLAPWTAAALTAEMRANLQLVSDILRRFERAGLVRAAEPGHWIWRASPELDRLADAAAAAHAHTPLRVTRAIADSYNRRIQQFADAFKLRPDKDSN